MGDRVTHVRSLDLGGRLSRFHQPPRLPSSHSMRRYTVSSSQCSHPGPGHSNALDALVMLLPRNPWWNEAGKVRHLHLNWPRGSPATSKRRYGQPMTRCITTERVIFIYCYVPLFKLFVGPLTLHSIQLGPASGSFDGVVRLQPQ